MSNLADRWPTLSSWLTFIPSCSNSDAWKERILLNLMITSSLSLELAKPRHLTMSRKCLENKASCLTFFWREMESSFGVCLLAVPHEWSLRTQCQHVLLGFDVLHEFPECKQTLQASVHVAVRTVVWESDEQTHKLTSTSCYFNDRQLSVSSFTWLWFLPKIHCLLF